MRILIHNMNNSLFPDADPNSVTWTGPPPVIVTVQSLLYANLTTSLFATFLAMLGKQWVNLYLRNRGGSAADKSRDRQRKLDGFEKWHFRLAIESLPVMLQLALLLLGLCSVEVPLDDQSHSRWGRCPLWDHLVCLPQPRGNILQQLPLPDTPFHSRPSPHRLPGTW